MKQKIRAIILDDEINNIHLLLKMLERHCPDIDCIGHQTDALLGLKLIQEEKPDLLFLDIQMPSLSGFDVLKKLEPVSFEVIVITAHDEFALQAFDHDVIGFITKPILTSKLIYMVEKAQHRLAEKSVARNVFSILGQQLPATNDHKIALATSNGIVFVENNDILYCESSGNYTHFHILNGKKIIVSRQLGDYEKLLPEQLFVRIHDKYIIHLRYVNEYVKGRGGEVKINASISLPVSSGRKDDFLSRFEHWLKRT